MVSINSISLRSGIGAPPCCVIVGTNDVQNVPKYVHMRTCLACLDWNNNVHRSQKVSKTGAPVYRIKVGRSGKKSVHVKVKKCYKWQDAIFLNIRLSKYHVYAKNMMY